MFHKKTVRKLNREKAELETFDLYLYATLNNERHSEQIVFEYGTLVNAIQSWRGKAVLDIGSGRSTFPHWMAYQGASVTMFEHPSQIEAKTEGIWGQLINWTQTRFDKEALKESYGNMLHLPFEDKTHDLVTSFSVIEHLDTDIETLNYVPYPEQTRRLAIALSEMIRVTKPGGIIYITSDCCDYTRAKDDAWKSSYYFKNGPAHILSSAWPVEDVQNLFYGFLERHGCSIVGPVEFEPADLTDDPEVNTFRGPYFSGFSVLVKRVT